MRAPPVVDAAAIGIARVSPVARQCHDSAFTRIFVTAPAGLTRRSTTTTKEPLHESRVRRVSGKRFPNRATDAAAIPIIG